MRKSLLSGAKMGQWERGVAAGRAQVRRDAAGGYRLATTEWGYVNCAERASIRRGFGLWNNEFTAAFCEAAADLAQKLELNRA